MTITGANFGSTQGTSTVKFNGTTATTITSWSATSIVATVPTGATTGNVVVNASGVNSNGVSFTVVAAPSITSLSPTSGAVGASVTITGANFGSTQGTEHGKVQRDDGNDDHELECNIDCGDGADRSDDGQRSGERERSEQQRGELHGCGRAQHHEPVADDRGGRRFGDDHGHELRLDAGDEHGHIQRHDGDDDHELECDIDCGDGADGSDDGQRSGECQRSGQ